MARETTVITPEHVEVTFELAGVGSRFLAALLDTIIQVLAILLVVLVTWAVGGHLPTDIQGLNSWLIALVVLLVFAMWSGYFLYFEARWNGQTPGKRMAGVRVIRDTGHPLDFRSALLRNVMRAVDLLPGIYAVGFVAAFLSQQYRRLGDHVAGTLVVKTAAKPRPARAPRSIAPAPPDAAPVAPEAPPSLLPPEAMAHLGTLTRDDYRTIRHFLDRRRDLEDRVAASLATRIAEPLACRLQLDPTQIEDTTALLEELSREYERRLVR